MLSLSRAAERGVEEHAAAHLQASRTPGASISITGSTEEIGQICLGNADLAADQPVTPDTRFGIGSVGKTFTAMVVLGLATEGRLASLHDGVDNYVPWLKFPDTHRAPTVHELLTHTGGLPSGGLGTPGSRYEMSRLATMPLAAPGGCWSYSNLGYQLLGYLVEELTGMYYEDAVATRLLGPAGMNATSAPACAVIDETLATGYQRRVDWSRSLAPAPVPVGPFDYAGNESCYAAPARDLARLVRVVLGRGRTAGRQLLAEAAWRGLVSGQVDVRPGSRYGYGMYIYRVGGHRWVAHSGNVPGYKAMILADLDAELGVAIATNGPGDPTPIARHVLDTVVADRDGGRLPPPRPPRPPEPVPAGGITGVYTGAAGTVRLESTSDGLGLRDEDRVVLLERRGRDRFHAPTARYGRHLFRPVRTNGQVTALYHGPDCYVRAGSAAPPAPPTRWLRHLGHYRSYNPWLREFHVVDREGSLVMLVPPGGERSMHPVDDTLFMLDSSTGPDYLRFDEPMDGISISCDYSGAHYSRAPWSRAASGQGRHP